MTIGFVIDIPATSLDMKLEMRDPTDCGPNKLCLYTHEWPKSAKSGVMVNQNMVSVGEKDLFIHIKDGDMNSQFYLASPCSAELLVETTECKCADGFYDEDYVYATAVIQMWGYNRFPDWWDFARCGPFGAACSYADPEFEALESYNVDIVLPKDSAFNPNDPEYTKFVFPGGHTIMIDGKEYPVADNTVISPQLFEMALRSMDNEQIEMWFVNNAPEDINFQKVDDEEYRLASFYYHNYDSASNTVFKSCKVASIWDTLTTDYENPTCININAYETPTDGPNFCYEPKWDSAAQAGLAVETVSIVVGVAAGLVTSPTGVGAIAAYCAGNLAISCVGGWITAETMAEDKWPSGIDTA